MQKAHVLYVALATAGILLVPFVAMQFTNEVDWDQTDFIVMGVLIFGTGLAIDFALRKADTYKVAAVIAIIAVFLYIWAELAVGIFNIPGISGS